ncbi:MAG: hypothetical protein ACXWR1_18305, partial [Bdellovibrionota bacterium]
MASPVSILLSGAGLAVVRLAAGLIRSKWIATMFGMPGVGLAAQATQFQIVGAAAASFSTSAAMIQGARGVYRDRAEELFRCAFFLILAGFAVLTLICGILGFGFMGEWLLGPGYGARGFALVFFTLPFALVSSCFLEGAFFVHDRFDRYSVMSGLHSIAQALIFVAASWEFGMRGILLAFPLSAVLLFLLFGGDLVRLGKLNLRWFLPKWNTEMARFLASHGLVMFATGVGGGFLLLFARSAMVRHSGLNDNGALQVPIALSSYGSAIMTNFLWGRIHPHISAGNSSDSFELSLCSFTAFVVALGTWVAAPVFVPLVYAKDFSAAIPLVSWQCLGDIFHYSFFALAVALLASGRIKAYLAGWATYYLPYFLLLIVPGFLQPRGFVALHLAGSVLALSLMAAICLRHALFRRDQTVKLLALALGLGVYGAAAVGLSPGAVWGRAVGAGVALALAFGTWQFIYGEAVKEQLRLITAR